MQAKEAAAGEENLKAGQDFLAANKSEDGVIETAKASSTAWTGKVTATAPTPTTASPSTTTAR